MLVISYPGLLKDPGSAILDSQRIIGHSCSYLVPYPRHLKDLGSFLQIVFFSPLSQTPGIGRVGRRGKERCGEGRGGIGKGIVGGRGRKGSRWLIKSTLMTFICFEPILPLEKSEIDGVLDCDRQMPRTPDKVKWIVFSER